MIKKIFGFIFILLSLILIFVFIGLLPELIKTVIRITHVLSGKADSYETGILMGRLTGQILQPGLTVFLMTMGVKRIRTKTVK